MTESTIDTSVATRIPLLRARRAQSPAADWRGRFGRGIAVFALIGAVYAIGAELSWQSFGATTGFAFFPPAGITVAALILCERRWWPYIAAAIVTAELAVDLTHAVTLWVALGFAVANAVEPLVGAGLVRRWTAPSLDLGRRAHMVRFVAGAVVLGPAAGALVGATVQTLDSHTHWLANAFWWCVGDGVAVLAIGLPILLCRQRGAQLGRDRAMLVALVAAGLAASIVGIQYDFLPTLLILPVVVWAALRFGDYGVAIVGAIVALVVNYATAAGYGVFASLDASASTRRASVQGFVVLLVIVGWLLAVEVAERSRAVRDRDRARSEQDLLAALAEAHRQGRENAERLQAFALALANADSVAEAIQVITRSAQRACRADYANLAHPPRNQRLQIDHGPELAAGSQWDDMDASAATPLAEALRDEHVVVVPDVTTSEYPAALIDAFVSAGFRAVAALPLRASDGRVIAALGLAWSDPQTFGPEQRVLLDTVASMCGQKLERARIRESERREKDRVEGLQSLTAALGVAMTAQEIGRAVADHVRQALRADAITVGLVDAERNRLDWLAIAGYPENVRATFRPLRLDAATPPTDAVRHGKPVVVTSRRDFADRYRAHTVVGAGVEGATWVSWPLRIGADVVGTLGVMWREHRGFEPSQRAFVSTVADLTAQALTRARAYADQHAIATILQQAVLPSTAAHIEGFELGGYYRSATVAGGIVGGDWHDALALPDGSAYFAIGDVVGHGLAAVEDMTQLRNAGRTLAIEGHGPARILTELARVAFAVTHAHYATMAVVVVEPDGRHARVASAGHPPAFVWRRGCGMVETVRTPACPPLGVTTAARYDEVGFVLDDGDVFVLYTDGLVERRGEVIDLGLARIEHEFGQWNCAADADDSLDDLCHALVARCAVQPQFDDVCVLAARAVHPSHLREARLRAE